MVFKHASHWSLLLRVSVQITPHSSMIQLYYPETYAQVFPWSFETAVISLFLVDLHALNMGYTPYLFHHLRLLA
jgi:hypothetical protein